MIIRVHWPNYAIATIVVLAACGLGDLGASPQDRIHPVIGTPNNQFRVVNTYPEYWVDGKPFLMHGAAFFYHRIPRDRWAEVLLHLKALGINTIDLYPLWNWQQPEENILDFDGHTNPRRDLSYLLRLIELMDFKLTFRPGPYFTDEWRNGGYPDWLLRRPEYGMSEQSILEGRYPLWNQMQYDKSEEAATRWLENKTHLDYTRRWYHDVFALVNPLLAENGGPLINIQIDDDQALGRENYNGPNFWKYMDLLRTYAKEATHDSPIPYYINGADMRVNAEANDATAEPFWNTGQDYQSFGPGGYSDSYEAAKNKFLTEVLKTEPLFPPTHIEFLAGWDLDDKDTYARLTHPSNSLMAMRVMLQNGLKGLSHHPANDTLYPAGYECPWANYFYTQENAITFAGGENARAAYIRRSGRLIDGMGALLAATHLAADAGIIYPMATYPQTQLTPAEIQRIADVAGRLLWSGAFDHYNFELLDSDHTPLENFERYRVLLLPNPQAGEDATNYSHLGQYSEKAQRMIVDYVAAGGMLVVLPSRPGGSILAELLSPLGPEQFIPGTSMLHFADGSNAAIVGGVYAVTPSERSEVMVFARDAGGRTIGARFKHGKGQVLFFGGDFSPWAFPPGTHLMEGGVVPGNTGDFPANVQKNARLALPALMRVAAIDKKVSVDTPPIRTRNARQTELYVTELVADRGSHSFESRTDTSDAYGFVGLTNFSIGEAYRGRVAAQDPRSGDAGSASRIKLPNIVLGPRESLLLPLRIPLAILISSAPPGLAPADEVYYSTAELTAASYDGGSFKFQFNAPSDGEIALRLARQPEAARLDGELVRVTQGEQHLVIVKIPRGRSPDFKRTLVLGYRSGEPRIVFQAKNDWIAGESTAVHMTIHNPRKRPLIGHLFLRVGRLKTSTPLPVSIPPQSSREVKVPLDLPPDAPEGLPVDLGATLREHKSESDWTWHSELTVHQPFTYSLSPLVHFPLREDQAFPLVHPALASLNLPGEAVFHLRLRNWRSRAQIIKIGISGANLKFRTRPEVNLPGNREQTIEIRALPTQGSGLYQFSIRLNSGSFELSDAVALAAIGPGKSLAYALDYDRDGFEDAILENQNVRCFISPHAGGRSFALVLKDSNHNAFNSVGGMRDTFAKRIEPTELQGLNEYTRMNWMGLTNRPYQFQILSSGSTQAKVKLEYEAPDIYPAGVKLERVLILPGDQNVVIQDTVITPKGVQPEQAYVLENSVSFQQADHPKYRRWFIRGKEPAEFSPEKELAFRENPQFFATLDQRSGETFAILLLTSPLKTELKAQRHSAFFRITYPDLTLAGHESHYRTGYYFGKESPAGVGALMKTISEHISSLDLAK